MAWLTETVTETKKPLEWIVVVAPETGDPAEALAKTGAADCRENMFINNGDTVYLYYGGDENRIRFRCRVVKERIPAELKGEGAFMPATDTEGREYYEEYMRLELEKTYQPGQLPLAELQANGLPNVLGATYVRSPKLLEYLHSAD